MSANIVAFISGNGVLVTTRGPGKVHLLSYASNFNGLPNHVGATTTTNSGVTRFMISHSYTFTQFAFYWEGTGEAVFSIGNELLHQPVGSSWTQAVNIQYGGQPATNSDVSGQLPAAVQRDNEVTCFIIPDLI
ncbi:hypothetical protein B0H16DRAFT_1881107 [Mycena metata]|uniref:Uncharacterized protein n=1 Tax=Mycena metata TaxID=1033252 RepID=A0AAD7JVF9_9AGAR|nr:hypothetical protein B0H16DRAFT_1881107 [Mycena metata]